MGDISEWGVMSLAGETRTVAQATLTGARDITAPIAGQRPLPRGQWRAPKVAGDRRERFAFAAMSCGSLAFSAVFIWRSAFRIGGWLAFALFDDAMISMRYAENLADGHGLVWNPGGERVEGISNPLWTGWMALLHLLPVHPMKISLLVMVSGAVTIVATLWVVRRLAQELAPSDSAVAVISVALAATFYPLIFWSLWGMEVGVLAWLVGLVTLYAARLEHASADRRRRILFVLAVVTVAAVATRLDAVVPVGLVVVYCAWRAPVGRRARTALLVAGPPLTALVVMTAVRVAYYGEWLPNTYYLKTTGVPLSERLGVGLHVLYLTMLAHFASVVLAALVGLRGQGSPARWLLSALVVGQVGYSVSVGGDAWEIFLFANRYISVAVAPLVVLAALGVRRLGTSPQGQGVFLLSFGGIALVRWFTFSADRRWASATPVLCLGLLAAAVGVAQLVRTRPRPWAGARSVVALTLLLIVFSNLHAVANWWRQPAADEQQLAREGWAVQQSTEPDAVLAVWLAGAEPYFARRPAVDLYGKSDRHIARLPAADVALRPGHMKADLEWSIRTYRPDLIQMPLLLDPSPNASLLRAQGYEPLAGTLWVRSDSDKVDEAKLRRVLAGL